jgi:hypothetical protein
MTEMPIRKAPAATFEIERQRAIEAAMGPSSVAARRMQTVAEAAGRKLYSGIPESLWKQLTYRDPMQDIKESLARTAGRDLGLQALRLSEQSVAESFRQQLESMARSFSGVESVKAAFVRTATGFDPSQLAAGFQVQKFLQDLAGESMFKQLEEQAKRWRAPYEEMARSFLPLQTSLGRSSAHELLERIAHASSSVGLVQAISNVDSDSAEGADSPLERNDQAVAELVAQVANQRSIQDAVNHLVVLLENAKESRLQRFILLVIYPLVVLLLGVVLNPVGDFYVKKALEASSKQEANKSMRAAGREAVPDINLLKEFRFVGAMRLQVRATARARGAVIGQLQSGQVVRVIEKERDFTLIAWTGEDGKVELQGWVFSRYLERFK